MKPRIAVIHGEPAGIGPELIAKLLAEPELDRQAQVVLVGDRHVFELGQRQAGAECKLRDVSEDAPDSWWEGEGFPL
ncbi:MAG: 4-hydroxythreonine-4-phosphate dehydrogenase PdxA, partial [Alphaproteobacteria bacterium]